MLTLWMRTRYTRRLGRPGRDYTIHSPDGLLRYTAYAGRVPGPITISVPDAPEPPLVRGKPRRSFPISGRYDVLGPDSAKLGVITRSGRFFDAGGQRLGRFRDARSLRSHAGEGIATIIVEGIIAGDSGAGIGPGASEYRVALEGLPDGRLAMARLPFMPDDEPAPRPGRIARGLRRIMPARAADRLLERRPPAGWVFEVPETGTLPELLLLAAAILAVEISLW